MTNQELQEELNKYPSNALITLSMFDRRGALAITKIVYYEERNFIDLEISDD